MSAEMQREIRRRDRRPWARYRWSIALVVPIYPVLILVVGVIGAFKAMIEGCDEAYQELRSAWRDAP